MLHFKNKSLSRRLKEVQRSTRERRGRDRRLGLAEDIYKEAENRSTLRRTKDRRL